MRLDKMVEHRSPPLPQSSKAEFPAPLDSEELIFSISCGNTHLHWATHHGNVDEEYGPQIFWRTPHLEEKEVNDESEDLVAVLSRNLPDEPHKVIFGQTEDPNAADALLQSKKRAVSHVSVYVVSTNRPQAKLLERIWNAVPSRFHVLRGDHFFTKAQGRYDSMGTDRLAALAGAARLHGHPALVFDGGTATTYSATNSAGVIMGGGIGPGLHSKFRALTNDTDALPEISNEQVQARVNEAREKGSPIPTFARNTREAMMTDAFQAFALKGRNVIEQWLQNAYSAPQTVILSTEKTDVATKVNNDKCVICTGGDCDILRQLLLPDHGGVIEHIETPKEKAQSRRYVIESSKHLIHYGIACVLATQVRLRNSTNALRKNPPEGLEEKRTDATKATDTPPVLQAKERTKVSERAEKVKVPDLGGALDIPGFPVRSAKKKAAGAPQPAAKKPKTVSSDPQSFVRKRICKDFGGELYFGTVIKYDDTESPEYWHVEYDDGDEEDYSRNDLIKALKYYKVKGKKDTNREHCSANFS